MLNIKAILEIVTEAGNLALEYQKQNKIAYTNKIDNTPVTAADIAVNNFYLEKLGQLYPYIPIISEENAHDLNQKNICSRYFLIDPIDGTESFINCSPNFVSQLALIEQGVPTFAAIFNPARKELYYSDNEFSYLVRNKKAQKINVKENFPPKIYVSHRLQKKSVFNKIKTLDFESHHIGSSYKFCILARGDANLIPYLNSIHTWDIAPPDLIVRKAGGIYLNLHGKELVYNSRNFACENFIAASNIEHYNNCLNVINKI